MKKCASVYIYRKERIERERGGERERERDTEREREKVSIWKRV